MVEDAFGRVEDVGPSYLEVDLAVVALAACDVVVRLRGRAGYSDTYMEKWTRGWPP